MSLVLQCQRGTSPDDCLFILSGSNCSDLPAPCAIGGGHRGKGKMDAVTPLPYTLLSLERYRSLLGFGPSFFWQAAGSSVFPLINACDDIFYQFYWQNEQQVSREEIANAIKEAEDDITRVLGYSPAPHWVDDELRDYPRYFRPEVTEWGMSDVRGFGKSVQLSQGKMLEGGQRAVTLIQAGVAVVRTDTDGDGYKETATITATTDLTDKCELHCYFAGELANPDWEVRTPRSVTLSGGAVTFVFWSWQLINPELQQRLTVTTQSGPIDIEADASYVDTVDVYREYTDFTQPSAMFIWERQQLYGLGLLPAGWCCSSCGGNGCMACEFITQDGCIKAKNASGQNVTPQPAAYNSDTAQWDYNSLNICRDPDMVKVWYRAGDVSQEYLAGRSCDPLSHYWAQAIAWLATARINRPFCACNNSQAFPGSPNNLQRDMSFTGSKVLGNFRVSEADLQNPFGSRVGEVKAWHKVSRLTDSLMQGVAV